MPPRSLTPFEVPIANAVVHLGSLKEWEFAAFLEAPTGPLIEMRTLMLPHGADPSQDVLNHARKGQLVCHHNHLSQESLSSADWNGLLDVFAETWAHCEDGSQYRGAVLDPVQVSKIIQTTYQCCEMNAMNTLVSTLVAHGVADANPLGEFFRKDVVNRAMDLRGFVTYETLWGTNTTTRSAAQLGMPVGFAGRAINAHLDAAAQALAPLI